MKKVFAIVLLILGLNSFSQENTEKKDRLTPEQKTELMVKKMTIELDLNEKQQEEVRVVLGEETQKRGDKKTDINDRKERRESLSEEEKQERKEKGKENRAMVKEKMTEILTPEQMKKWEESRKEKTKKMQKNAE